MGFLLEIKSFLNETEEFPFENSGGFACEDRREGSQHQDFDGLGLSSDSKNRISRSALQFYIDKVPIERS